MPNPKYSLVTIDYPPQTGGVARYLSDLVTSAQGEIEVIQPRKWSWLWPRWRPLIRRILKLKHRDAVIVSHVFPVGTAAWIAKKCGGPEYVVILHGLDVRLARSTWKKFLLRRIVSAAQLIVVNSEATKTELTEKMDLSAVSVVVIHPTVTPPMLPSPVDARLQLGLSPTSKIVLSIARLVPRKGIDLAMHVMAEVQKTESEIEYVLIGDGPEANRLEALAEDLGLHWRWLPECPDEEKWRWLRAADIFFLPVHDVEGQDLEGFGIVFLEAAAVGIPVLAGRSGGVVEAVIDGETGILVDDPQDIVSLTRVLRRLLSAPEERKRLGEQGRERVLRHFSREKMWQTLETALKTSREIVKDIAVVIPCFNHAKDLRVTLAALTRQTVMPREIIVVDDGSVDQPEKVMTEMTLENLLPRTKIQFVRFEMNQGAPAARNEGARLTDSSYLLFLDADAELVPEALEIMVDALEDQPESAFAYGSFYWGRRLFRSQPFDIEKLREQNYIHTSALIRRSAFPGFDESLKKFQDWDLFLTMAEKGERGFFIDKILFRIQPRPTGLSTWLPRFAYRIPWPIFGWTPKAIVKYNQAEEILLKKHSS